MSIIVPKHFQCGARWKSKADFIEKFTEWLSTTSQLFSKRSSTERQFRMDCVHAIDRTGRKSQSKGLRPNQSYNFLGKNVFFSNENG